MRIISWNINSVRLRLAHVLRVLEKLNPDILCLQETKCPDEYFPHDAFIEAGFPHIHIQGMKSYNGQAIISKRPFLAQNIYHRCGKEDCRHIAVELKDFTLHNLYVPAGGDEPDVTVNEKYAHKLEFVEEITRWFKDNHHKNDAVVALGDFNIAPQEHDVWSHKQLLKVISHTPPETERLAALQDSLNWIDTARHFIPAEEKSYSWWSYRNRDWRKSNRGRRLDHIWLTPALAGTLHGYSTLEDARDWEKPSDHIPIIVDLKI